MIRLGVNIDHVATVRQARRAAEPDPVAAAVLALLGGADGITVHLREDRRHIQERDVRLLRPRVTRRLNLELAAGIEVSIFVDPDPRQIDVSQALGAKAVEIQTARYSEAKTAEAVERELDALRTAATHARDRGLAVHLGHGLNYTNVRAVVRLPGVQELNIGHSIVSRAVLVGLERAVRDMKEAIRQALPRPV